MARVAWHHFFLLVHCWEEEEEEEEEEEATSQILFLRLSTSLCSSTTSFSSPFSSCDAETGTHSAFVLPPCAALEQGS